jgi:hypothetical protein
LNVIYGLREPVPPEPTALRLPATDVFVSRYIPEYGKPQYRFPTVFRVIADVQYDIYHLYACGPNTQSPNTAQNTYRKPSTRNFVYYDVAYIPNYEKSVFMNGLFRNIRENRNLDYIEESDEDEDFENTREDKYVDLTKELYIECGKIIAHRSGITTNNVTEVYNERIANRTANSGETARKLFRRNYVRIRNK